MLPRCGRAAHICGANCTCSLFFLLQLHFLKLTNSQFHDFYETSCKFRQGNGAIAARWQAKAGVEPPFAGRWKSFSLRRIALRKTNCVRFGRIASLSACVLFADGCVIRICYESFLDYNLQEVSLFLRWRTAFFLVFLRFLSILIVHSLQGAACPLHPSAKLSQLDRSSLRLVVCSHSRYYFVSNSVNNRLTKKQ